MFSTLRATLAAAAIAVAGLAGAGSASAAPAIPVFGPGKIGFHFCRPHLERKMHTLGVRRIGLRYYRVIRLDTVYVNRFCFQRVVSSRVILVPLPYYAPPRVGA
jgi:hypothetical protein